jgi:hypothetical protein
MIFELWGELHAPGRVDGLRLRGLADQLGVSERGHETRNGDQRRDEPPFARRRGTRGNRLGKLSRRHVSFGESARPSASAVTIHRLHTTTVTVGCTSIFTIFER